MSDCVVEVRGLSRRFGKLQALKNVSLEIEPGLVYGLVGANGAGKTTLMKHLLGLLRAKHGSVRVFGKDPVRYPVEVLSRVGYLSEERDLPEWMSIQELLAYTAAYYPRWDQAYADELVQTFGLDIRTKIKHLSKGMRAQAGLVAAVAHRPDLLLLDEPSTGLDAVVRKDILNAIIRTVADSGRTVIFSSHLLDEVELMSDHVLMVNQGEVVLEGSLDAIRQQHHILSVQLTEDFSTQNVDALKSLEGVISVEPYGRDWRIVCGTSESSARETLAASGARVKHVRSASLQEIFVARVGRSRQPEDA